MGNKRLAKALALRMNKTIARQQQEKNEGKPETPRNRRERRDQEKKR